MDLNCDMGESFGIYTLGLDEEVMQYITSANVACGWHAGDPLVMMKTVGLAKKYGVGVGAHPGYPDLVGFGRRPMDCTADEIRTYVMYQIGALQAFCAANKVKLQHVKPHGSLYLAAVENESIALAVARAIVEVNPDLIYVAFAGSKGSFMGAIAGELGLRVVYEAFPDRAYTTRGTLASRREPGAVITDPKIAAERALMIATSGVLTAIDGSQVSIEAQTLCVHGDNPAAVEMVRSIRKTLECAGVEVAPMITPSHN